MEEGTLPVSSRPDSRRFGLRARSAEHRLARLSYQFGERGGILPDGQIVASGSADRTTKLWRTSDGTLLRTLVQCSGVGCRGASSIAFSPDGQTLATAGSSLKLWNVANGALIRTISAGVASIAFSPDGQTLATTGGSGYNNVFVTLFRVSDGTTIRTMTGGGSAVAFSPNGAIVAASGRRGVD